MSYRKFRPARDQEQYIHFFSGLTLIVKNGVVEVVLFWLIITTTNPPHSEPLKDYTATEIMESCAQCHYNYIGLAQITRI